MTGPDLVAVLERRGFDFFAGVPCSLIEDVIATLERHPRLPYVDAVREDIAVGLAGGAWFAGRRPAVLMQNSGLGTSLNALASFSLTYGLPTLLLVTWRGYGGRDAPEHLLMGEITPRLLEALGLPARVLTPDSIDADVAWARDEMDARMRPVALLVPPGVFESGASTDDEVGGGSGRPLQTSPLARGATTGPLQTSPLARGATTGPLQTSPLARGATTVPLQTPLARGATTGPLQTSPLARGATTVAAVEPALEAPDRPRAGDTDQSLVPKISRMEAIAAAIKELNEELVVCANGYPSREACAVADRPQNFYMIGSMGLAAAIGLGLALGQPARPVVVFDGDGNLLMSLGVLANVVALGPRNFIHCVVDNEAYGSTGNQRSPSSRVRLDRVAQAAGYRSVAIVTSAEEVAVTIRRMLGTDGPHLLLAKVTREVADVPRISHPPESLRDRFRAAAMAR